MTSSKPRPTSILPVILVGAWLLRLAVFLVYHPWDGAVQRDSVLVYDSWGYHNLALCILNNHSFCGDAFRTPGYPGFIASIYWLVGVKPWAVLLMEQLVDLVSIYLVFRIGERLFSRTVGVIAAIALAIDPNAVFATANYWSDGLFVALLLAAVYYYLQGVARGRGIGLFVVAGLLLALDALVRPPAEYYALILAVFLLFAPAATLTIRLKWITAFVAAFVVGIAPWIYRNAHLYDAPKLSSVQGENLLFWQVSYARASFEHRPGYEVADEYKAQAVALGYSDTGNPFVNEKIVQKLAVDWIKQHPIFYATRWIAGAVHIYTNLSTTDIISKLGMATPAADSVADGARDPRLAADLIHANSLFASKNEWSLVTEFFTTKSTAEIVAGMLVMLFLVVMYAAFAVGLVLMVRSQRWLSALFVLSILFFTVTGGPIGLARFRMPITPFCILIGAVALERWFAFPALEPAGTRPAHS